MGCNTALGRERVGISRCTLPTLGLALVSPCFCGPRPQTRAAYHDTIGTSLQGLKAVRVYDPVGVGVRRSLRTSSSSPGRPSAQNSTDELRHRTTEIGAPNRRCLQPHCCSQQIACRATLLKRFECVGSSWQHVAEFLLEQKTTYKRYSCQVKAACSLVLVYNYINYQELLPNLL
jgi:hypothetical protein